ncbi:MAG: hypothetical protein IJ386_02350 [Clostridia bacterium]|nr:hypothetical protein [Clostridia bacterium]
MKTTPTSVIAAGYSLELSESKIAVSLAGEEIAVLNPLTALNTTNDDNETFALDIEDDSKVTFKQVSDTVYEWESTSALWDKKVYRITCFEKRFEYTVTVYGKGRVDTVDYFGSHRSPDWKVCSSHEFCEGFYPDIALGAEDGTYYPDQSCNIYSCLSVPPMFYHSFKIAGIPTYLAFGVVAEMGEHNFCGLAYNAHYGHFSLSTDQYGHAVVDGEWTTPKMIVYPAKNHYDAGKRYCDFYFDSGICEKGDPSTKPRFWYGPIACGWIEQDAYGHGPNGDGTTLFSCKEIVYREMLEKLEKRDLHPTILIIDDKWQDKYGTAYPHPDRWPDLRGFIDDTLEKGIRTMMWYQLWNAEGLPEECLTVDEEGNSYIKGDRPVADPSHPVYQKILKENVHRILSSDEGCYNAFGFKLDFAFCQPHGRKVKTYSGKYGAELLYDYIKQIRTYAKEAKPDAIINASPMHPMFASLVDHARLHDYGGGSRNGLEIFEHRAKLWGMANPTSLIDSDSGGFNTHRDMMRVMKNQPNIGIPDLYCVSDLPGFAFTEEEWSIIANLWRDYSEKCDNLCK